MPALRLILGDQLSADLASLREAGEDDLIVMAEVVEEASYVPHHKIKIAFLFSAMRHFADALREDGREVRYFDYDPEGGPATLKEAVQRALDSFDADEIVLTEPGEWCLWEEMCGWSEALGLPVRILDDDRFLCSRQDFASWADGRNSLLMETFYRMMRKRTGFLMQGADPEGGQWNYDSDNRKAAPKGYIPPDRVRFSIDETTQSVLELVEREFSENFGSLEHFNMAVTRQQAFSALHNFIDEALAEFGDFQDAMVMGEAQLNHSLLSAYINAGLLGPMEVCQAVQDAYDEGRAPLNAAEGFIRQIIGWREYVRGVYWLKMPEYAESNFLNADGRLPEFYWDPDATGMACVAEAVRQTRDHAYSHHIQRLMVTGNFALLAGVAPAEINDWYLAVYSDAYEWVELPNTHGMAIFADGGVLATKPYASSGNYINKMSDFCQTCAYSVTKKEGENACPFNYLYWDFLDRNKDKLKGNHRLFMPYNTLSKFSDDKIDQVRRDADRFLKQIGVRG